MEVVGVGGGETHKSQEGLREGDWNWQGTRARRQDIRSGVGNRSVDKGNCNAEIKPRRNKQSCLVRISILGNTDGLSLKKENKPPKNGAERRNQKQGR